MIDVEHISNQVFDNGWEIDVKYNPNGFNDMYSTNYKYSVMVRETKSGFTSFHNLEKAFDVFQMIIEVSKY